jgi:predicted ABC-type exoprotein transport system permease subunit
MFDEGSPKQGHVATLIVGGIAGAVMIVAAFSARVSYSYFVSGAEIRGFYETGGVMAMLAGIVMLPLLYAWHRGNLAGQWPLVVGLVLSAIAAAMLGGDWYRSREVIAFGGTVRVSAMFYPALVASIVATLATALPLIVGAREVSFAHPASWRARPRRDT